MFADCVLGSCNIGSGENFINFDAIAGWSEYHFKMVWDEGTNPGAFTDDVEVQWKQTQNPLSITNFDTSPTEVLRSPSNTIIPYNQFMGLSVSGEPAFCLLDGNTNGDSFFCTGYPVKNQNLNGNLKYPGSPTAAQKTQLFVRASCDEVGVICDTGKI